ncbi:MAG: hypothetical protein Q9227_005066 [Pyrenula ochraceoflavens]
MGRELLSYPKFWNSILESSHHLQTLGASWNLSDELLEGPKLSRIDTPEISQPACTALQIALVDLMDEWCIRPDTVIGHSSGEIAAAYCARYLSKQDALAVAYYRGIAVRDIAVVTPNLRGAMLAVGLSEEAARAYLGDLPDVVIACVNSPSNVTLSGNERAIDQLQRTFTRKEIFSRKLQVQNAYHSPHMQVVAKSYAARIANIRLVNTPQKLPRMISSVSGKILSAEKICPEYWVDNMVSQVQFFKAMSTLLEEADDLTILEIGPHSALQGPIKEVLRHSGNEAHYASLLKRNRDAAESILEASGKIWCLGHDIDLRKINEPSETSGQQRKLLKSLPPYSWNHSKVHWHETRLSKEYRLRRQPRLDLLGAPSSESKPSHLIWNNYIRVSENPWIGDHRIQGQILYPAAGMIVMILEAARQLTFDKDVSGFELTDVNISTAIIVPESEEGVETSVTICPKPDDWYDFTISSYTNEGPWQKNCIGQLRVAFDSAAGFFRNNTHFQAYQNAIDGCTEERSPKDLYSSLKDVGLSYGPMFQLLGSIMVGKDTGISQLQVRDTKACMPCNFEYPHLIHPTTLDGVFQTIFLAGTEAMVPTAIKSFYIAADCPGGAGAVLNGYSRSSTHGFRESIGTAVMSTCPWTHPKILLDGVRCTKLGDSRARIPITRNYCSQLKWIDDVDLLEGSYTVKRLSKTSSEMVRPPASVLEELEHAAYVYIKRTMMSSTQVASNFKHTFPHLDVFKRWMDEQAASAEEGLHPFAQSAWFDNSVKDEQSLLARVSQRTINGRLLVQVGEQLPAIMSGEVDGLEVLLKDDVLSDYYAQNTSMTFLTPQVCKWAQLYGLKNTEINILEIGAGTGSMTRPILEALTHSYGIRLFSKYTYTDVSSAMFGDARSRLQEWQNHIEYRLLDIDQDPSRQGYLSGSYDLIVASNVFHATKILKNTLKHTKQLLRPGGKLLLVEATKLLTNVGLIFGVLPGWWYGENDGRYEGPTLSQQQWNSLLKVEGFSGVELAMNDFPNEELRSMIAMITTLPHNYINSTNEVLLLAEDSNGSHHEIFKALCSLLVDAGFPGQIVNYDDLQITDLAGRISVSFSKASMDSGMFQPLDLERLKHIVTQSKAHLHITVGGENQCPTPHSAPIHGMFRTLRSEDSQRSLSWLDVHPSLITVPHELGRQIMQVLLTSLLNGSGTEKEYILGAEGALKIPRLLPLKSSNLLVGDHDDSLNRHSLQRVPANRQFNLTVSTPGDFSALYLKESTEYHSRGLAATAIEIQVHDCLISCEDTLTAAGKSPYTAFSPCATGIVTRVGDEVSTTAIRDRVFVYHPPVAGGAAKTLLVANEGMVQPLPPDLPFEKAVMLGWIGLVAVHAIENIARLQTDDTVLVLNAASVVGRIVVQLARSLGVEVYAQVNNETEMQLLQNWHQLPRGKIFPTLNKGTPMFEYFAEVAQAGFDVVLNLSPQCEELLLSETIYCLTRSGRYIDTSAAAPKTRRLLERRQDNVTHSVVDLDELYSRRPQQFSALLERAFKLIEDAKIHIFHDLKINVFLAQDVAEAFKTAAEGTSEPSVLDLSPSQLAPLLVFPTAVPVLRPNATYILSGGLGGISRSVAPYLAAHGARHLAFLSRSAGSNDPSETSQLLTSLHGLGVRTLNLSCDITSSDSLSASLQQITSSGFPPIYGLIQSAAVLSDSLFENMTYAAYSAVTSPKIAGSWNLHNALLPSSPTRSTTSSFSSTESTVQPRPQPPLDFFILLSSSAGVMGTRGQSAYASGSTFQDALARHRRSLGLPATSLDLGMISDVGMVARDPSIKQKMLRSGFFGVTTETVKKLIGLAICGGVEGGEEEVPAQVVCGVSTGGLVRQMGVEDPYWMADSKFAVLRKVDLDASLPVAPSSSTASSPDAAGSLKQALALATASSSSQKRELVQQALLSKLARSLNVGVEDLDPKKSMSRYGVDSLVAVEVRNWILKETGAEVSVFEILGGGEEGSVAGIAGKVVGGG